SSTRSAWDRGSGDGPGLASRLARPPVGPPRGPVSRLTVCSGAAFLAPAPNRCSAVRLDRWVFFLGATLTPRDLKKTLSAQGFQIYRVFGSSVLLAERVRENLIMDSGVA